MINVQCQVSICAIDGKPVSRKDNTIDISNCGDGPKIVLQLKGHTYVVDSSDLIAAILNARNLGST